MRSRNLKIYILTEATPQTGMGHLGRCIALSDAFSERGIEPVFIVDGGEPARNLLAGKPAHFLDWITELRCLSTLLTDADIVIVDSYHAPESLYRDLAAQAKLGVWLDDNMRLTYPAGMIVNGTVGAEGMGYPPSDEMVYLLGANYIILRQEFWEVSPQIIREQVEKMLVTFGGSDILHLTQPVLELLTEHDPELEKHVVLGAASVQQMESDLGKKIFIHSNLSAWQMRALMQDCDVAVSAAGQTINELARCGLPSLVFQVADNQKDNIRGWKQTGFIPGATTLESLLSDLEIILSRDARQHISETGHRQVDGQGAKRIAAQTLREYYRKRLTIRPVRESDFLSLFELANDPEVRKNSFSTDPIPLDDHKAWFARMMADDSVLMYIFEIEGDFVGQVRFDRKVDETVTSLSIDMRFRGYGLGSEMLRKALLEMRRAWEGLPSVAAYIKPGNLASIRTFEQVGYVSVGDGRYVLK